jgi:hypothetical protein
MSHHNLIIVEPVSEEEVSLPEDFTEEVEVDTSTEDDEDEAIIAQGLTNN